jgi:flavin reductase (DIM6/NTAB) family NADH-FMN oxidoreductase RutF
MPASNDDAAEGRPVGSPQRPGAGDPADATGFEAIIARSRHPMVIVTTVGGGERAGCLVGFHTQCSMDPARYLVCVSPENRTFAAVEDSDTVVVHHLAAHQTSLASLFGEETGDETDKFAWCAWSPGPGEVPVLSEIEDWWAGHIVDRVPLGDHIGFVLEPVDAHVGDPHPPFTSDAAASFEPGHPRG